MASSMDGPTNVSAQSRQGPSSTRLPSMRMRRQSQDRAACATSRFSATDLPPPGSPPTRMFFSASSTFDLVAVLVHADVGGVEDGEREHRHCRGDQGCGHDAASFQRAGAGAVPRKGAAVPPVNRWRVSGWAFGQAGGPESSLVRDWRRRRAGRQPGRRGRRSARSFLNGESGAWLAARVSRRMMSMVTSWDQLVLRVTRASRA